VKACIYVRVSTEEQSVDAQVEVCRRYCEINNLEFDIFHEKESGGSIDRPVFKSLLSRVKRREYSRFIVFKLDRFSRSVSDTIHLLNDLSKWGCDFVSVTEMIDMSTPIGRLQMQMLAVFAQFEREMISERTRAALTELKRKGRVLGRPSRYLPPELIDEAKRMRESGMRYLDISKALGISAARLNREMLKLGLRERGGR
jgi:DNA invertase Pin-like site-specific DNA recombinase